jgi:hypothetical protein
VSGWTLVRGGTAGANSSYPSNPVVVATQQLTAASLWTQQVVQVAQWWASSGPFSALAVRSTWATPFLLVAAMLSLVHAVHAHWWIMLACELVHPAGL